MDLIKKLSETRANVYSKMVELNDSIEGREFSAEEQASWDSMNADLDSIDARIKELSELGKRNAEMEALATEYSNIAPKEEKRNEINVPESDSDILRSIANGEVKGHTFKAGEVRDLTKGTATAGGNTVPTGMADQIVEHLIDTAQLMPYVTVLQTGSGEDLQVPKTNSYSSAALVAEAASIGESDPAFGQVTLGAFKYAFLTQASQELMADSKFDIQAFLAKHAGVALGNAIGSAIVNDNGSSKPNGIMNAASTGVTAAGTTSVTADELIDLYHSVIPNYRSQANCIWLMNDTTASEIRKLKDTTNQYLWTPGFSETPDRILGKPVVIDSNVPNTATGLDAIGFGDASTYYVRMVNGVDVSRSDDYGFANGLISWRFQLRADGDLIDTNGFKVLTMA